MAYNNQPDWEIETCSRMLEIWAESGKDLYKLNEILDAIKYAHNHIFEEKEIVGQCEQCECDVTTDQDYLKLKTGAGAGRIYCEEHVGWGECQKAWSASCGCDVCYEK